MGPPRQEQPLDSSSSSSNPTPYPPPQSPIHPDANPPSVDLPPNPNHGYNSVNQTPPPTYPPQSPIHHDHQYPPSYPPQSPIHSNAPPDLPQTQPNHGYNSSLQHPPSYPPQSPIHTNTPADLPQPNPNHGYNNSFQHPPSYPPRSPLIHAQAPPYAAADLQPKPTPGYPVPQQGYNVVPPIQTPPWQQQQQQQQQPVGTQNGFHGSQAAPNYGNQPQSALNMHGRAVYINPPLTEIWTTQFFDCHEDPSNCLITAFFPCVTFGQIAELVDDGHTSCTTGGFMYSLILFVLGCPCIYSCSYRTKLRNKFNLMETPMLDWVAHCFCEPVALCQEYRELKNRGLDPALGWVGNNVRMQQLQQQQQQQVAMTPPMGQAMHK